MLCSGTAYDVDNPRFCVVVARKVVDMNIKPLLNMGFDDRKVDCLLTLLDLVL